MTTFSSPALLSNVTYTYYVMLARLVAQYWYSWVLELAFDWVTRFGKTLKGWLNKDFPKGTAVSGNETTFQCYMLRENNMQITASYDPGQNNLKKYSKQVIFNLPSILIQHCFSGYFPALYNIYIIPKIFCRALHNFLWGPFRLIHCYK